MLKKNISNYIVENYTDKNNINNKLQEQYLIAFACTECDISRVIVFGAYYMFICKPTGKWERLQELDTDTTMPYELDFKMSLDDSINGIKTSEARWKALANSGAIEVVVEKAIPRNKIFPALDSLSCYPYLSRGTFRPLYAVGEKREDHIKDIYQEWYKSNPLLPRIKVEYRSDVAGCCELKFGDQKEYFLGFLYRQLLDFYRLDGCLKINDKDLYLMLSPAQLEAAAAFLLRDLNYMPITFRGGSRERVDIRARKIDSDDLKNDHKKKNVDILKKEMNKEFEFDCEELFKQDYIDVQCKNYDVQDCDLEEFLVHVVFVPVSSNNKNKKNQCKIISLAGVLEIMGKITLNESKQTFELLLWKKMLFKALPLK